MRSTAMMKCLDAVPFSTHVPAALTFEDVRDVFQHLSAELASLKILMAKRYSETQYCGRGVVDVLIKLLGRPEAHLGGLVCLIWTQARPRERIL